MTTAPAIEPTRKRHQKAKKPIPLDELLRPYPSSGLPVSESFERRVWFVRLLDAGWQFETLRNQRWVRVRRPGRGPHVLNDGGCDCHAWRFSGVCPHMRVLVALGRTEGIRELVLWFESRDSQHQ